MLPTKTFLKRRFELFESDFDVDGNIKLNRFMQLMQNAATEHADKLGFGWDNLNSLGVLWVLSKVKIVFCSAITKDVAFVDVVTWPKSPDKFFANRLFEVYDDGGNHVASVLSVWAVIDKNARKFVSADKLADIYKADFDDAEIDVSPAFCRVRGGDDFVLAYSTAVRRSMLDINKHVNNTNYITFAYDATDGRYPAEVEIVYHKEVVGGAVDVYVKHDSAANADDIVGYSDGALCFTVRFKY